MSLIKSPAGDQVLSGQYARRFLWSVRCEELWVCEQRSHSSRISLQTQIGSETPDSLDDF